MSADQPDPGPAWITACIPVHGEKAFLREAVLSLLGQSYPWIRVVVINDGDPQSPWPKISDIRDPRLIRFDCRENKGRYFATHITLLATPDPLLLIQDADDWSEPRRAQILVDLLTRSHADFAGSVLGQVTFEATASAAPNQLKRLGDIVPAADAGSELIFRMPHHGLWRASSLRALGGYWGGQRIEYDSFLINVTLALGRAVWDRRLLYWRRIHPRSLTRAACTGLGSPARQAVRARLSCTYSLIWHDLLDHQSGRLNARDLVTRTRRRIAGLVTPAETLDAAVHAEALRGAMREASRRW